MHHFAPAPYIGNYLRLVLDFIAICTNFAQLGLGADFDLILSPLDRFLCFWMHLKGGVAAHNTGGIIEHALGNQLPQHLPARPCVVMENQWRQWIFTVFHWFSMIFIDFSLIYIVSQNNDVYKSKDLVAEFTFGVEKLHFFTRSRLVLAFRRRNFVLHNFRCIESAWISPFQRT